MRTTAKVEPTDSPSFCFGKGNPQRRLKIKSLIKKKNYNKANPRAFEYHYRLVQQTPRYKHEMKTQR